MPKRPTDTNELARLVVDLATGEATEQDQAAGKNAAAVQRGRKGGIIGGKARAASLTAEQRTVAAKKAAAARWGRPSGENRPE